MTQFTPVGLLLVAAGPISCAIAFAIAHRTRPEDDRAVAGAVALAGLLWFVVIADWLPPVWKTFWNAHSITAGGVCTVLGIGVAWMFESARANRARADALYANWGDWLRGQHALVDELLEVIDVRPDGVPGHHQSEIASRARMELLVQQQWVASSYAVLLQSTTEHERGLLTGLGNLRHHGSQAIRHLTVLLTRLQWLGEAALPAREFEWLWKESRVALENLSHELRLHEQFVTQSRYDLKNPRKVAG